MNVANMGNAALDGSSRIAIGGAGYAEHKPAPSPVPPAPPPPSTKPAERVAICEDMLGLSNDSMPLIKRIEVLEVEVLGGPKPGAIPDRIAAIENRLGIE